LLRVETIARRSLHNGIVASWPKPSVWSEVRERNAGIAIVLTIKVRGWMRRGHPK
jgi:hypothetical protein